MEKKQHPFQIQQRQLLWHNRPTVIYGGEYQYFRIPAQTWEPALQHLKRAGLDFIACYIPWIWHEITPDEWDFTGQTAPERDLLRLMELCQAYDLWVMIRPGPYVYAEYQGFGIPAWLRTEYPEILIQYENETTSYEVSLQHPIFMAQTKRWLARVWHTLTPYHHRIIACQIDNETGLPQFGGAPYCGDFNPHTITCYQHYLSQRYAQIESLNQTWSTEYPDFKAILPPRKGLTSLAEVRHWTDFIENYLVDYLKQLRDWLREIGVDCWLYLNDPYICQWPNHSPKKSKLEAIGYDIYSKFTSDTSSVHDVPFALSYTPAFYRSLNPHQPLVGAEVGVGWFDPRVKVMTEATLQKTMIALLRGTQVVSHYILQDCTEADGVPWIFQSPLDQQGHPTARWQVLDQVGQFLIQHRDPLASSTEIKSPIAILKYVPQNWDLLPSNTRVWSALDQMDSALSYFTAGTAVMGALIEAGYNPVVHDAELITDEELRELEVLFFPSTDILDPTVYQKLLQFVQQGGTLVTFGAPATTDLTGCPYDTNPLYAAKSLGATNKTAYGTNSVLSQVAVDMVDYQRMRRFNTHKLSLNTLDMMHPFVDFNKYIGRTGIWLETDRGDPFWASRFTTVWQGGGVTPLLRHPSGGIVGYSKRLGLGSSIFLGTLPGLFFDTPAYYTIEADKKQSVIRFLLALLKDRGLEPLTEPLPHTEVILRQEQSGALWVGIINRGAAVPITLELNIRHPFQQVEVLFNSAPDISYLQKAAFHRLQGYLAEQAVGVWRLL